MTIRQRYRLAMAMKPLTSDSGWEHCGVLFLRGLIPWQIQNGIGLSRVAAYLAHDKALHWHPVIRRSRLALLGFSL